MAIGPTPYERHTRARLRQITEAQRLVNRSYAGQFARQEQMHQDRIREINALTDAVTATNTRVENIEGRVTAVEDNHEATVERVERLERNDGGNNAVSAAAVLILAVIGGIIFYIISGNIEVNGGELSSGARYGWAIAGILIGIVAGGFMPANIGLPARNRDDDPEDDYEVVDEEPEPAPAPPPRRPADDRTRQVPVA